MRKAKNRMSGNVTTIIATLVKMRFRAKLLDITCITQLSRKLYVITVFLCHYKVICALRASSIDACNLGHSDCTRDHLWFTLCFISCTTLKVL